MLLRAHELIRRVGRDVNLAAAGRAMAERYEAAPVVVTSQVQNNRPQVCRGPFDLVDAARVPGEPQERLLHDVLSTIAVIDEQSGQSDQRRTLRLEQPDDELLRLDADRL